MKNHALLFLILVLGTRVNALAGEIDLDFAFSQLASNGSTPFARRLYDNPENAKQLVSRLDALMPGAGTYVEHEIVSQRFLTKRVERLIIAIYFENFPIYLRIDFYETAKGRICLPATVSKEASDILPHDLIAAAGK
jgi:hypothetical protein